MIIRVKNDGHSVSIRIWLHWLCPIIGHRYYHWGYRAGEDVYACKHCPKHRPATHPGDQE